MHATQLDIENRFGLENVIQYSDRANTGSANVEVIADAIAQASATIDSYVAQQYQLPLPGPSTTLKPICVVLAWYLLAGDRISEDLQKMYDAQMRQLREIASGTVKLIEIDVLPGQAAQAGAAKKLLYSGSKRRLFGVPLMRDY